MNETLSIPLFPLHTVLFPGQLLPLHIFEPRYQLMIKECIADNSVFGIVLIRKGFEVGTSADPFLVGTTARIKQIDRLENGSFDLICIGEDRFQILNLDHTRPYLSGKVKFIPLNFGENPENYLEIDTLKLQLVSYLTTLTKLTGSSVEIGELPAASEKLTSLASIALRISNQEKQDLLAINNLQDLIRNCNRILRRENHALKTLAAIPDPTISASTFYFPN